MPKLSKQTYYKRLMEDSGSFLNLTSQTLSQYYINLDRIADKVNEYNYYLNNRVIADTSQKAADIAIAQKVVSWLLKKSERFQNHVYKCFEGQMPTQQQIVDLDPTTIMAIQTFYMLARADMILTETVKHIKPKDKPTVSTRLSYLQLPA